MIPIVIQIHQANAFTLASDLDGTLIPIQENKKLHQHALSTIGQTLSQKPDRGLIYASGRSFSSVKEVIKNENLPEPTIIISDVGTAIHIRTSMGWSESKPYERQLTELIFPYNRNNVVELLKPVSGIELQAIENQTPFKISYVAKPDRLPHLVEKIDHLLGFAKLPFQAVSSVDPNGETGLIDVLPKEVSKFYALHWLCENDFLKKQRLIYAGDSGNDLDVFNSNIRSIIVGNTSPATKELVKKSNENYCSSENSTSGVLEGCRYFGWV